MPDNVIESMWRPFTLILAALFPPLSQSGAQQSHGAVGRWTGCFEAQDDERTRACGDILFDTLITCGRLPGASFRISFEHLAPGRAIQLPNQGTFNWHGVTSTRIALVSGAVPAESPRGEALCVMPLTYLQAWGEVAGDSLTGTWTWGGRESKQFTGSFSLKRTRSP